jgi:hypothetical protein
MRTSGKNERPKPPIQNCGGTMNHEGWKRTTRITVDGAKCAICGAPVR